MRRDLGRAAAKQQFSLPESFRKLVFISSGPQGPIAFGSRRNGNLQRRQRGQPA